MKFFWILIFLFTSIQTFSQIKKGCFKIGYQRVSTMHLGVRGTGYHAQYEFSLKEDGFTTSIGIGQFFGKEKEEGRSRGTMGLVTWDNSYKFFSSEASVYLEINGMVSYTEKLDWINLKAGGGITFFSNSLNYYQNLNIVRGLIESYEPDKHRENKAMLNLVLDNDIILNDQFVIHCKFIFRKIINETVPLIRTRNGTSFSKSSFDSITSMVIGLGYRF